MGIREIAKAAGVASSTVSLVLSGAKNVSDETASQVKEVAERLGYLPGRAGRPKKTLGEPKSVNSCHRIALIAWKMEGSALSSPIYSSVILGVEKGIREFGKTLVLCHVMPEQDLHSSHFNSSVDGIILFGKPQRSDLKILGGRPCIRIMGPIIDPSEDWDHITYNDQSVGVLAANYMLRRKHSHVVSLADPQPAFTRGGAFVNQLNGSGCRVTVLEPNNSLVVKSGKTQKIDLINMEALVEQMLKLRPLPSAMFVPIDIMAQALYLVLHKKGLQPGSDIEIVSCNNEEILLNGLSPRPTTIDIHSEEIGLRAVGQLMRRIKYPDPPRETLMIEPTLIPGEYLEKI